MNNIILFILLGAVTGISFNSKKNAHDKTSIILENEGTLSVDVNDVSFDMVLVEGDKFYYSKLTVSTDEVDEESKFYSYLISLSDYYIGKYEVTQKQWNAIVDDHDKVQMDCPECPVTGISWRSTQRFIKKLNEQSGKEFALPTDAQWEFAARGGKKRQALEYAGSNNIEEVAWCKENAGNKLHPVGTKKPNILGIYDMSGNASEFCQDYYTSSKSKYLKDNEGDKVNVDPTGPTKEDADDSDQKLAGGIKVKKVVHRGGSIFSPKTHNRVYLKQGISQSSIGTPVTKIGFRLAMKK